MGTSRSDDASGEFEQLTASVIENDFDPSSLREWSDGRVRSFLEHLYNFARKELMSGDQELLRHVVATHRALTDALEPTYRSNSRVRTTILQAFHRRNTRKYEAAKILAADALEIAREENWGRLQYEALIILADCGVQQGNVSAARGYYDQALACADSLDDDVAAARVLLNRAMLEQACGRPRRAVRDGQVAFERFLETGDNRLAGWALISKSASLIATENYATALETSERARNLFEAIGGAHGLAMSWSHIGLALHFMLQLPEARSAYHRALVLMRSADLGDTDTVELYIALLKLDLGDLSGGRSALEELADRTSSSGRLPHLFVAKAGLVSWAALAGDETAAYRHLTDVEQLAGRTGFFEPMVCRQLELAERHLDTPRLAERIRELSKDQRLGLRGDSEPD